MGKGDKKTKRGKIILGSYGVRRSQRNKKVIIVAKTESTVKVKKEKPVKEIAEIPVVPAESPVVENVENVAAETPAKKKVAKTSKKAKSAEPELDLGVEEKTPVVETPEMPEPPTEA